MNIGYEAKRAYTNNTGLGNYSRGIIKSMATHFPDNEYLLYTPEFNSRVRVDFIRDFENIQTIMPKGPMPTSLWRSKFVVKDLKRDGVELYHGLSHELPMGIHESGIKSVVTIHDLIFKRYPNQFGFVSRKIYAAKVRYACKNADKVVAISERTKADLIELLHIDPKKIEVIYQDCDQIFKIEQSVEKKAEVKLKYSLPKRYILYIGTIEERKNLLLAIKALTILPEEIKLVVVGKATDYAAKVKRYIKKHNLGGRIVFIANASFNTLPAIYQQAELFVYPSRFEGFGIPILEALVSGVPVIAAKGSCLEEAGGPDSLYIDPDDVEDLATKINLLIDNESIRTNMIEKGKIYAQRFDEKKIANQMMSLYQKTLNNA